MKNYLPKLFLFERSAFFPNIVQDEFESKNFTIEKSNLIAYMRSIAEDKQAFASLSLQELFFQK